VADQAAGADAVPTGSLAQTGTDLLLPAGLGLLLVAAGAVAVYGATRRRGSHA
jgi:LPXTG-motif cell wall-anchored protein